MFIKFNLICINMYILIHEKYFINFILTRNNVDPPDKTMFWNNTFLKSKSDF